MADVKHSFAQTGTGPHKIGVSIDLFNTTKLPPKSLKVKVDSNRLKTVSSPNTKQKPKTTQHKYNIDLQAMQHNIEKLAIKDQRKSSGITPRDLYYKAHPGLKNSTSVDYTDPRQWYSSSTSKKMMKKLTKSMDKNNSTLSVKSLDRNESVGNVSFLVTFPSLIAKPESIKSDGVNTSQTTFEHKLPHLHSHVTENIDVSKLYLPREKTQIQVRSFSPHIDESQSLSSSRKRQDIFASTESLDSIGTKTKRRTMKHIRHESMSYIETPPSAIDRELTRSMEEILKSVTGPENVKRSLKQPPNASIPLPIVSNNKNDEENSYERQKTLTTEEEFHYEDSRPSTMHWQTGVGLRKTYSYQSLNNYSEPLLPFDEDELSTRLVKVSSQESLVKSRDKFKKLRLPQKRAVAEEIQSFRNNYNLRQKSVLNLKMRKNVEEDKVPMNKVQVSHADGHHAKEYDDVPSRLAPYIEGKVPQHFIMMPDEYGEIIPQVPSPEKSFSENVKEETKVIIHPGTSFSQIPNDDSSHANTLKTYSALDEIDDKPRPDFKSTIEEDYDLLSPFVTLNKEEEKKLTKGRISRGSTISQFSRSKSKERLSKKEFKNEEHENNKPHPTSRSPNSKPVYLDPVSKKQTSTILPPSQKALTKSYIPPKLKKHNHIYADSLDTLLQQHGTTTRRMLVGLALNNKAIKRRKKQIIRAFDQYLIAKLGEKLAQTGSGDESAEVLTSRIMKSNSMISLPHPPAEEGKRPVFRKMKTLVPFDERGRPITRGKDEPIVNEEFPDREVKPLLRPQGYRLDNKQYPPPKPATLLRDYTFDKKSGTIIDHNLERSVTIGEISFPEKNKRKYQSSDRSSTLSVLTSINTPAKQNPFYRKHSRHNGGKDIEQKRGERFPTDSEMSRYDNSSIQESTISRNPDTPVDSITASMMKEIYDNLNDYLVTDSQGIQCEADE